MKDSRPEKILTYVSYPAKFPVKVQDFLREAAREAGFPNVQMVSEAEAAMQYTVKTDTSGKNNVFLQLSGSKATVMLVDMGAGTTDIAVYSYDLTEAGNHELLGYYPDDAGMDFGGREIDDKLCEFYKDKLGEDISSKIGHGDTVLGQHLLLNYVKEFK